MKFPSLTRKFGVAITILALMFLVVQDANAQIGGGLRKRAEEAAKGKGKGATESVAPANPANEAPAQRPVSAADQQRAREAAALKQPWSVDKDRKGTILATFVDGVLTFSGTGEMFNFQITMHKDERPWAPHIKEITTAVVEEGITELSRFAFYNCENLTSISLPTTLKNIGGAAFYGCKSLPSITLPASLTDFTTGQVPDGKGSTYSVGLFGQCMSLTEINVAAGNERYKSVDGILYFHISTRWRLAAYPAGRKAETFNVPDQTPVAFPGAFSDNVYLKNVVFPVSFGELQASCFRGCTALQSITFKQATGQVKLGRDVFVGVDMANIKIFVPKKVLENYTTRADSDWKEWASRITGQ